MPQRSGVRGPPKAYIADGTWPDGRLADDAPVAVTYAQIITRRLREAVAGRSQSQVAQHCDVHRSTLNEILTGRSWPDVVTLAKLETHLEVRLWPD